MFRYLQVFQWLSTGGAVLHRTLLWQSCTGRSCFPSRCETATMVVEAAGRVVAPGNRGGKSGLHRAACRLTAGGSVQGLRKVQQKIYRLARGKGEMVR